VVADLGVLGGLDLEERRADELGEAALRQVEERILDSLVPGGRRPPWEAAPGPGETDPYEALRGARDDARARLRSGALEDESILVSVVEANAPLAQIFSTSGTEYMGIDASTMAALRGGSAPRKSKRMRVADARRVLEREEQDALLDRDRLVNEAIRRAEETGILFIDEIDKVAGRSHDGGPDVSREGVQRDLLPIVEGSTVSTRYGPVRTDHVLFIAAGAFHVTRPDDLIPELQGRFPIRVKLDSLEQKDFVRILTEPVNALPKQYASLLGVDGVELTFERDGIEEIASLADRANIVLGDIGARRLHTVVEQLLTRPAFEAPDALAQPRVRVDRAYVRESLRALYDECDLSKRAAGGRHPAAG